MQTLKKLAFFLMLVPLFIACADKPASVDIYVVDNQDRAISNAKVSFFLTPGNSIIEKIIYTDALGKASWDFDFIATFTVYGYRDNYYGQSVRDTIEVTVARGEVTPVNLVLTAN